MSTNNVSKSRVNVIDALQKLAGGLTKHATSLPTFTVAGTPLKPGDVATKLQGWIALAEAVLPAKAAWQAAVAADKAALAQLRPVVLTVQRTLQSAYSTQVDVLADFGLKPAGKRSVSPATRTAAALKAKATRAARGTKGSAQKEAITTRVTIAPAKTTSVTVEGTPPAGAAPPTAAPAAPAAGGVTPPAPPATHT